MSDQSETKLGRRSFLKLPFAVAGALAARKISVPEGSLQPEWPGNIGQIYEINPHINLNSPSLDDLAVYFEVNDSKGFDLGVYVERTIEETLSDFDDPGDKLLIQSVLDWLNGSEYTGMAIRHKENKLPLFQIDHNTFTSVLLAEISRLDKTKVNEGFEIVVYSKSFSLPPVPPGTLPKPRQFPGRG